jgi:uncharacterized membrane protein YdjX (TVP38/TMEM64 family)
MGFSLSILLIWMIWGGHWAQWTNAQVVSQALQGYGVSAGLAGVVLLVLDLVLPVPGTVVMSALGYLYGTVWGAALGFVGSFIAGMIGYGVGRLFTEKTARWFLGEKDFVRGKDIFARGGGWVIALSRAVPILPEALAVTAGLLRMPISAFVLSLTCGSLPMAVLFAWIGATGHDRPVMMLGLSFAVPAVLWTCASWGQRRNH